jgi:hydroxyacylglutathione hydrolase
MDVNIYPIRLGFDCCYVIQDEGTIMIDGGVANKAKDFRKALETIPVAAEDIQLIVLTHGHFDHVSSARDIKEITGAKIAMHRLDKDRLETPLTQMPAGVGVWGSVLRMMLSALRPFVHIPPAEVDVVLGDEGLALSDFGVSGKVIYTPGHTAGSVSVLLDAGDAFVGDLAMNAFPLRLSPGLPVLADDIHTVRESWKYLLELGAQTVYPGHGKPFPIDAIRKALA